MGRRSEHSREELQALIIAATSELVAEQGADRVTARQIAEKVGYTPGMLYSVFRNVQDIYLHVNVQSIERLRKRCADAAAPFDDPLERIRAMCHAYVTFALTETHTFDLLYRRSLSMSIEPPEELSTRIRSFFAIVEANLATLAPQRSESERRRAARALWSGVHGTAELALTQLLYIEGREASRDVVDALLERFLDGWSSDGTRPAVIADADADAAADRRAG